MCIATPHSNRLVCACRAPRPRVFKLLRQAGCRAQDRRRKPKPLAPRQPGEARPVRSERWKSRAGFRRVQVATGGGDRQRASRLSPRSGCTTRCVAISMPKCLREVGAQFVCEQGLPQMLTFDHDPREVFSPAGRDFPSALVRFLLCLGVQPSASGVGASSIGQPRSRRSSPLTETFLAHDNQQRPNQARSCGNQPPRVAYPAFPTLPAVPQTVVTPRWLVQVHKRAFARTKRAKGDLPINCQDYYGSRTLAGKPGQLLGERRPEALRDLAAREAQKARSRSKACMESRYLSGSM
jgi:hypothetical protein